MQITREYTQVDRGVIPPRCRKPRDIFHEGRTTVVEVREVTAAQAPVAFRVRNIQRDSWDELRWHDGQLWSKYLPWSGQTEDSIAGSKHFPADIRKHSGYGGTFDSDEEAHAAYEEWARRYLIVDGVVYQRSGEPRYYVATYGLGGNHGGTALSVDSGFHPNIKMLNYFTAAQFEQAREAAIRVALDRGDTKSAERLRTQEPDIQLLIPEAQTLVIPGTYTVTIEYTDRVTLDIVADTIDDARDGALRQVKEDEVKDSWMRVTHDHSLTRVVSSQRKQLTSEEA